MAQPADKPGGSAAGVAPIELLVASARRRAHRTRNITIMLLFGLLAAGVYTSVQNTRQLRLSQERETQVREQERLRAEAENQKKILATQAENARKASSFVASGAYKAGRGRFKEAIADYDTALSIDATNPGALAYKGYLELRMGQSKEAEDLLRTAVQHDPYSPWGHYNFALALWANGKQQEALGEVAEVLRLDPSFKSIIATDPQFNRFRSSPDFTALIKSVTPTT